MEWNSVDAVNAALVQYRQQYAQATEWAAELQQQMLRLEGAIGALEQLQQNGIDERVNPTQDT